jgi:preprotein translocase subunit YajC
MSSIVLSTLSSRVLLPLVAADGAPPGGGLMDLLFPLAIVFLIFWFLVIRPSSRERKAREAKVRGIAKHDKVITNAGIHGVVVGLDEETVTLRVDEKLGTRIRFARAAIWQVNPTKEEAAKGTAGAT